MENKPEYPPNVHFIDEYPDLAKKVWLRRLAKSRQLGSVALHVLPTPIDFRRRMESDDELQ